MTGQAHGIALHADVVVVGAGIIGSACAWRLAEGGARVVVVEQAGMPATGSTGRSAAGVRHQFSEPVNVQLSLESIAEYRAMPEADYRPVGYLLYVPDAAWDAHARGVAMQRALGARVEALDLQSATARVPAALDGLKGASWCADDGVVDPHGICLAYVARARSAGARFAFGHAVTGVERVQGSWQVRTAQGAVTAPVLVNAAGAWSGGVARLAGLTVPVTPARRMVFVTGPLPADLAVSCPYPLTVDLSTGFWFRSEHDRLIFGLANDADTGFSEGVDWNWLEPTVECALRRFPWFERLSIDRRACWWGYYENTPDHNPIIGRMPDAPGWINACGFSGHGVQHAAAVGRVVARDALGQALPIDVSALSIRRFDRAGGGAPEGERLVV